MKALKISTIIAAMVLLTAQATNVNAQDAGANNTGKAGNKTVMKGGEDYGSTLNIGAGGGYYSYMGNSVPFLSFNYEFTASRNFTIAPSIGFATYRSRDYYYGGSPYYYRRTIVPVGVKGTYYFDQLLNAGPKWDFYLGASLGFLYDQVTWQNGYLGDKTFVGQINPLYLDLHIGSEYHINNNLGIFLDLSTGVSTFGLAVHHMR